MSTIKGHVDYGNGAGPQNRAAAIPLPKAKATELPATDTAALRGILLDEIAKIRNGDVDPARSKAIAGLAKGVIDLVRLDMDFRKIGEADPALAAEIVKPVRLAGSNA